MKFGAHMSTAGGVSKALERGKEIGCEIVQIFVKNNMQWFGRRPSPDELKRYANELAQERFSAVFGHAGYLINLAGPESANRDKSLKSLIQEIHFATDLGLPFLVLHPGAHLQEGEENGFRRIVAGIDAVVRETASSPVCIALETTAGQGTCLGHRIADLATIYDRVERPERLRICLDTAHLFEAGYDVREPEGWDNTIREVEKLIGLNQVVAIHVNDSKTDFASKVDRHAGIGQGKIGKEAFRHIVNDPRFRDLPACLETPKSKDMHEDIENLAILRSLEEPAKPLQKAAKRTGRKRSK